MYKNQLHKIKQLYIHSSRPIDKKNILNVKNSKLRPVSTKVNNAHARTHAHTRMEISIILVDLGIMLISDFVKKSLKPF